MTRRTGRFFKSSGGIAGNPERGGAMLEFALGSAVLIPILM